jgi:23S rRNA (adenine2503-C2)-methyltransferase
MAPMATDIKSNGIPNTKRDLKSLSLADLRRDMESLGEKAFRAEQILKWIYSGVSFDEMTNLPKTLRQKLADTYFISTLTPTLDTNSGEFEEGQTVKFLFALHDGKEIETVLIPDFKDAAKRRLTVCVSSQVGCAMACKFCATGYMGFTRNLTLGEILDQVLAAKDFAQREWNQRITNLVFMGMGEPMLNYERVIDAADILSGHQYPFQIGERHITLSTVGIVPGILKLAESESKINLAVSLHAAREDVRQSFMPVSQQYSLGELRDALITYYAKKKREIFIEYLVLRGINDTDADADALMKFCRSVPSKINLIDYNPIPNINYERADDERKDAFVQRIAQAGIFVSVRRSRGKDIDAACGQLATRSVSTKKIAPKERVAKKTASKKVYS